MTVSDGVLIAIALTSLISLAAAPLWAWVSSSIVNRLSLPRYARAIGSAILGVAIMFVMFAGPWIAVRLFRGLPISDFILGTLWPMHVAFFALPLLFQAWISVSYVLKSAAPEQTGGIPPR